MGPITPLTKERLTELVERGDGDGWPLHWGRPVALPARRGGDNDPRSCLGSLSVMSAKTPIHLVSVPY